MCLPPCANECGSYMYVHDLYLVNLRWLTELYSTRMYIHVHEHAKIICTNFSLRVSSVPSPTLMKTSSMVVTEIPNPAIPSSSFRPVHTYNVY